MLVSIAKVSDASSASIRPEQTRARARFTRLLMVPSAQPQISAASS